MDWIDLRKPIFALSPMADMTDEPFCRLVKSYGADVMFREMVSAEAIVRGNEKTWKMVAIMEEERPVVQQIFGKDPAIVAEAARLVEERVRPDGIDLNMGCPVRKLVCDFNGAALMREPDLAGKIVGAVKSAVGVPVSVKIRLGWSDPEDCLTFAPALEAAGADLVSIHGRTKAQGYSGKADWGNIARVKKLLGIPVLANGDIVTPEDAKMCLEETGADGVLVARGALGNPWVLARMKEYVETGAIVSEIDYSRRKLATLKHASLAVERYGDRAWVLMRKHLAWYWKGFPGAQKLRSRLVMVNSLEDMEKAYGEWEGAHGE